MKGSIFFRAIKISTGLSFLYSIFDALTSQYSRYPQYQQYNPTAVAISMFIGHFIASFIVIFIVSIVLLWAFKKER